MDTATNIAADYSAWQIANRARVTNRINSLKQALIEPLRQLGIARVEVMFEGCGDSGAVEEVDCRSADHQAVVLPGIDVAYIGECDEPVVTTIALALENLTYAALELNHSGWEVNEGANGRLIVDVVEGSFALDCSLRFTSYEDHTTDL